MGAKLWTGCYLAQDRIQCWAVVNMVTNFQVRFVAFPSTEYDEVFSGYQPDPQGAGQR